LKKQVPTQSLDKIHHVAIQVDNVGRALEWYQHMFQCCVTYQDETWALLEFANVQLALVSHDEHPCHVGFVSDQAGARGKLTTHRDGTKSQYVCDPSGNAVELLDPDSVETDADG
jgi:YD repeat-containing protein